MRRLSMSVLLLALACGEPDPPPDPADAATDSDAPVDATARATIRDSTGRDLGSVLLTELRQGVRMTGSLAGLAPGDHGIHLHTQGSCTPDFAAAGGHWNPMMKEHGTANLRGPHWGDYPNFVVSADSSATLDLMTPGGHFTGEMGLLDADGATVVVHAGPDDYRTDPDGASGARIACGVVSP